MAEKSTFIKLDRNITEWGWYQDANTFRVFIHLLIKASIKNREYAGIIIKRGEYITTYDRISTELKLSIQQSRTALEHLKSTGEITITRYSKFQVISIKNYDFYQSNYENQQSNNNQITINQQSNNNQITIKQECKEEKECKESKELEEESAVQPPQPSTPKKQKEVKHKYGEYQHVRLTDSQFQKLLEDYTEAQVMSYIRKVDEYCQQHGKSYKDYNLTIRNWMSKDNVQKIGEKINPYSVYDEYDKNQDLPF